MTIALDRCAVMAALGIRQLGDPALSRIATPLVLPRDAALARCVETELLNVAERVQHHHNFANGMGVASTQLGHSRSVAVIRTGGGEYRTFFNPRMLDCSVEFDEQYEGCLSFFSVRGLVPRPVRMTIAHTAIDGTELVTNCGPGLARLLAHELDHLAGRLYTDRLRTPMLTVEEYQQVRQPWRYEGVL